MNILGINYMHSDSSACIIKNNKLVAAVEEERFNRIKHFFGYPVNAINFCLEYSSLNIKEIDIVSVNFNSNYNFKEKIFFSLKNLNNINLLSKFYFFFKKNSIKSLLENHFNQKLNFKLNFVPHHLAHISSSFLSSGLDNALGISIDGSGDLSTC